MSKYTVTVEFMSDAERKDVEEWAEAFVAAAPDGAFMNVRREPLTLSVEDVTKEHIGHVVRFDTKEGQRIEGKLQGVYSNGLAVHNAVWMLPYGVVQIMDW